MHYKGFQASAPSCEPYLEVLAGRRIVKILSEEFVKDVSARPLHIAIYIVPSWRTAMLAKLVCQMQAQETDDTMTSHSNETLQAFIAL